MKLQNLVFAVAFTLAMQAMETVPLSAETFTVLHNFTAGPNVLETNDGQSPQAGLILSDNTLYGTTAFGGSAGDGNGDGTVFKVNMDGTGFTNLHVFTASSGEIVNDGYDYATNTDGAAPQSDLVVSGNTLYGTAVLDGSSGNGTVFAVNTDGTGFTNLHSFTLGMGYPFYTNSDGGYPNAVIISGNTLYGTALRGGSSSWGTVFKVNTDGTDFTNLHSFINYPSDGAATYAGLIISSNMLYGAATHGGSSGAGMVFTIKTDGTRLTNLYSFTTTVGSNPYTNSDGANPVASLVISGNTLYGTAERGGSGGNGTVFAVNTDGTGFTNLHSFSITSGSSGSNTSGSNATNSDGANPWAGLIISGDTLYGTAEYGGSGGNGTVFAVNTDGTGFTNLHSFSITSGSNSTNNDGANPLSGLILSGNTLYGTAEYGGTNGIGTVFALSLTPSAPIITTQPQNQTAQTGSNVSFNITTSGYPLPNYQWQFNGQNIPNATNATLTLNSVTAANSGGYSVVISNPYGSVTSTTASLAVLGDGANGNTPVQASPSQSSPVQIGGVDSLVLVTHGFAWDGSLEDESWVSQMANSIQQSVPANWTVVPYIWNGQAWGTPDLALINAAVQGTVFGNAIGQLHYNNVHLISHSAGAAFIEAAAKAIKAVSPSTEVHETFLAPYLSFLLTGIDAYGANADWADNYSDQDWTGGFTASQLENAYNADVSWLDPNRIIAPYGLSGQYIALSSHGWPIGFYMETVTNTDSQWCGANYGFFLSEESSGWNNRVNYPIGATPQVICSSSIAVQNPNPGIAGETAVVYDVGSYALSAGASLVSGASFVLNSVFSVPQVNVKPEGIQPLDGTNSTNTPAWLAVGVTVTNSVNFVEFDVEFTDTNAAQGLLTVYWNTNQVGMVDERIGETNFQTYRFALPNTVTSGIYTLSFRLDSFDNSSSVAVTNVVIGYVGTTQPITLGISITNGAPLIQLTAATNFNYLIQSSTNLVDWTPTVLLFNTNGTVQFIDSAVTNSSARFYQAVMPSE
jgi:uncharacterized repeat protein (TIGR03803 family)